VEEEVIIQPDYGAGYEGEWAKVMGAGQEINIAIHLVLQFKHSKTCV
jgi:hypothetical protein